VEEGIKIRGKNKNAAAFKDILEFVKCKNVLTSIAILL
jgi:hypothetical protein